MSRVWSPYQQAIFSFVEDPNGGNAVVEAVAGSGKSTTIVEAMNRLPEDAASIFLAFNKAIAAELKAKGVNARTFHSLVFGPVMRAKGVRDPDMDKLRNLQQGLFSDEEGYLYGGFTRKLVGLAKQMGVGIPGMIADTDAAYWEIVEHHDMELENDRADLRTGIELARKLFAASLKSKAVDFDDMLYFAVRDGISLPKFDWVFVDEAQDTNPIQRAILRKLLRPGSRMVAVGDPAQAIYGFRGADSESLAMIAEEFGCVTLPLSVSYRCAANIITLARTWVNHIEARDGAPDGTVRTIRQQWTPRGEFKAGDLVVCRTTKPLVALGYRMLKDRMPVQILGKEIGDGLIKLIEKQKARGIEKLIEKLYAYQNREVEKARAKGQDGKVAAICDKVEAIIVLIDGMDENRRTIPALIDIIEQLFADVRNATILCTIHKSKGLEADRVFWLNRSACPSKWARQPWQMQQERNLCYVAVTRAKSVLTMLEDEDLGTFDASTADKAHAAALAAMEIEHPDAPALGPGL